MQVNAANIGKPKIGGAPGKTVYVRNLHDRVKPQEMEQALRTLFEEYGTIIDIVAKSNLKAKGQAFIVYDNQESAANAIKDIDGFILFERPMSVAFARTRSDVTVSRDSDKADMEEHKRTRLAEKERKKAREAEESKKRPATDQPDLAQPKKGLKNNAGSKTGVVPMEFLPPDKTLFVDGLPHDYQEDDVAQVFQRFPGFQVVNMTEHRPGIAFIKYNDVEGAIQAKKATGGMSLGGNTISVYYQRSSDK